MLDRIGKLFKRFSARHLGLSMPRAALPSGRDWALGSVRLEHNFYKVTGRADADHVYLVLAGSRRVAQLTIAGRKFALQVPYRRGAAQLILQTGQAEQIIDLPEFSRFRLGVAEMMLWPGFLWALAQAAPAALRWFRFHDPSARVAVRNALGLAPLSDARPLQAHVLADQPAAPRSQPAPMNGQKSDMPVIIIMPVYNALDVSKLALTRLHQNTSQPWHLILVEDCSTDPAVRPYLQSWAQGVHDGSDLGSDPGQVTLIENAKNLGFIGAVNRGFQAALDLCKQVPDENSVGMVLLNSDALLPQDWSQRLLAPLQADSRIASVTPMSNDAELLSVPNISCPVQLAPGMADQIDKVARRLATDPQGLVDMPTGVGFCMGLSLTFLRKVGLFDTAFGQGYGEEVDWCQRAIAQGGRHVAQPGLFVEHRGGASFGSAEKQRLLRANGAILSRRYPEFDQQVQDFIGDDGLLTQRMILGWAWAAAAGTAARAGEQGAGEQDAGEQGAGEQDAGEQDAGEQGAGEQGADACGADPVPVYLAHTMGGGAEMDLMRRVAGDIDRIGAAIVVRVGGDLRWLIELHSAGGVLRGVTNDTGFLQRLMQLLPRRRIIYSCGVGDTDPGGLPDVLLSLGGADLGGYHVIFHDYLPLSASYTLLDRHGRFLGLPVPGDECRAHRAHSPDGNILDLAGWRKNWARLLEQADALEVFSESSRELVAQAYPAHAQKIQLCPHEMLHDVAPIQVDTGKSRPPVIGVLGNIGHHKGAGILVRLSRMLSRGGQARLVVVGNLAPNYRLARPAIVHGDYAVADLPGLVARYGITCWLIPSIWPETFSFTTHEALATGLPVFAFDLGAQGDLVVKARQGGVDGAIPYRDGRPDLELLLDRVQKMNEINTNE